jgi:hypothetical protein
LELGLVFRIREHDAFVFHVDLAERWMIIWRRASDVGVEHFASDGVDGDGDVGVGSALADPTSREHGFELLTLLEIHTCE